MNTVLINDKEYQIKLGFNQLSAMEKELGKPLAELGKETSIEMMILMFKYAIKHQEKNITTEEAGDLLTDYTSNGGTIKDLFDLISSEIKNTMGVATPTDE